MESSILDDYDDARFYFEDYYPSALKENYDDDFVDEYRSNIIDEDYQRFVSIDTNDQSVSNLIILCIRPTVLDAISNFVWPIIFTNIATLLLTILVLKISHKLNNQYLSDCISLLQQSILILNGSLLIRFYFHRSSNHHLFWILSSVIFIVILSVSISIIVSIESSRKWPFRLLIWSENLFLIAINEYQIFFKGNEEFLQLRPQLMMILMKSISFHDELLSRLIKKESDTPNLIKVIFEFGGYLLHPSSILLGIWHPISNQSVLLHQTNFLTLMKNCFNSLRSLFISLAFLISSTCLIEYFVDNYLLKSTEIFLETIWDSFESSQLWIGYASLLQAYSTATQFHCSHYFICFLGQSMFDLWNFQVTITKPRKIEWPRSLVDVVVAWNIPMHRWLKKHVFQEIRKYCNVYCTIMATYLISSLMHGFNFQIWSVLLTLGLLTQAEFKLRNIFSKIFSACVESRECFLRLNRPDKIRDQFVCDKHQRTKMRFGFVKTINLVFTCIALINLAFLGSLFDGQPNSSSISNVWIKWKNLKFYSFIILITEFILYEILKVKFN